MDHAGRRKSVHDNFLAMFKTKFNLDPTTDKDKLSADHFAMIWEHYDTNESGYIDQDGLNRFFKDYLEMITDKSTKITQDLIDDVKSCYMGAYDETQDGRFHVSELAEILPTDENFLVIFRKNENITDSRDLLKIWKKYDTNSSGYIEPSQLKSFIRDLCHGKKEVDEKKLDEYAEATLKICDRNNDGRLGLREMSKLLNIKSETNFLSQFDEKVKNMSEKEKRRHINRVFQHYAQDGGNELEGERLDAFISDLMDTDSDMDMSQLELSKKSILNFFDINRDGKINLEELAMCLNVYKGL